MTRVEFLDVSNIDYPKHVSTVVFVRGCNFACPYCHNPDFVMRSSDDFSILDYTKRLKKNKKLIDSVVITGGEPTTDIALLGILIDVPKQLGLEVKLDTNGGNPFGLAMYAKSVDYIAMDVKTSLRMYPQLYPHVQPSAISDRIKHSISILKEGKTPYEFRITCVKPFVTKDTIQDIASLLKGAKYIALQRANLDGPVLNKSFPMEVCTPKEIREFKEILSSYVDEVIIR